MNAKVPGPPPRGQYDTSKAAAAAALLAAGEALVRASNALSAGEVRPPPRAPERKPDPLPVGDRLSGKQLGAIRAASRRAGLSRDGLAELLAETAGREEVAQLSRAEASAVLDKLSAMTGYQR
ncbi:MAG: hypothetical protein K0R38_5356 [Polyangiaceae bacterium]|nr:hypothetical protein [Polyangiaceae bacterium]